MADNNRTFFLFVVDRSGSMASPPGFRADMEGGINSFLQEQQQVPGKCRVTLAQFDNEYEEVFNNVKLKEVPAVTIQPRGMTSLFDAVGKSVTNLRAHINSLSKGKRPGKVLVTIVTDGGENSSKEWDSTKIKNLIKECTKEGWEFSYLGANQDAFAEGSKLGVNANTTMSYTTATAGAVMNAHTHSTTDWRTGVTDNLSYSGSQRQAADPNAKIVTPSKSKR